MRNPAPVVDLRSSARLPPRTAAEESDSESPQERDSTDVTHSYPPTVGACWANPSGHDQPVEWAWADLIIPLCCWGLLVPVTP